MSNRRPSLSPSHLECAPRPAEKEIFLPAPMLAHHERPAREHAHG